MKFKPVHLLSCAIYILFVAVMLAIKMIFNVYFTLWRKTPTILPDYHPDMFVHYLDLITLPGFRVEEYKVKTQDDYTVLLWRIVNTDGSVKTINTPALFMHGLADWGLTFFGLQDINLCFPYSLAKEGYDVWVGNNRGTKLTMDEHEREGFWNYNFDSLVKYDIVKIVETILERSKSQSLVFIGHSQGSLQLLTAVTEGYIDESKIKSFIGLGPVLSIYHNQSSILLKTITKFPIIELCINLGFKTILHLPNWSTRCFGLLVCNYDFIGDLSFCIVNLFCGFPKKNKLSYKQIARVFANEPGGCSLVNMLQWKQFGLQERIRRFDYGVKGNLQVYGSQISPEYNLHKLPETKFEKCVFIGTSDVIMKDCLLSLKYFKDNTLMMMEDYNHNDYLWSPKAHVDIYQPTLKFLKGQL